MSEREEKKNQRLGLVSSIGIHTAMLLLFLFVMGWKAPNPPLGEAGSGIELNFGLDDQGTGDVQPEVPVGTNENATEEKKEPEDIKPEAKQEEVSPVNEVKPDVTNVEKPLTSEEDSPVTIKEAKKETKVAKESKDKPADKPKDNVSESKKDEKKVIKPTDSKKAVEDKKGTPGNQGDDKGKKGDKGDPQGTLDAKALYGKQGKGGGDDGGSGGGGVTISGFEGFERPNIAKPEIPDESYGMYQFEVKVSKDGEVISIRTLRRGTSLEAERIFKKTIEDLEFTNKISNEADKEGSGIITFNVVAPKTK